MEGTPFTFPEGANFSHHKDNVALSSEQIAKMNMEGHRFTHHTIQMIDECRDAIEKMPQGKDGIVLGAGPNSRGYAHRGWESIDIDPSVSATYTADANHLSEAVNGKQYDFVMAERLTLGEVAGTPVARVDRDYLEPAVGHERLLEQARAVLKDGGRLIIDTVDFGDTLTNLPKSEAYAALMRKHGFAPVLEVKTIDDFTDPDKRNKGTEVTWYAEKLKEIASS